LNIVIIADHGVEVFKTWREVKQYTTFKKEDFAQIGPDYVLNCTGETWEVVQDVKMLERVAAQKVFSKDKFDVGNWLQVFVIIFLFFVYSNVNSMQNQMNGTVSAVKETVKKVESYVPDVRSVRPAPSSSSRQVPAPSSSPIPIAPEMQGKGGNF
jgi:hypothetical protein